MTETYVRTYYPTLLAGPWEYQEALRTQAAQNWGADPDRAPRGWTAIDAIRKSDKTGLPAPFLKFIEAQEIPEETKLNNVRRIVKDVWTWPIAGYLPWTPVPADLADPVIKAAQNVIRRIAPNLQLVDGKIYITLEGFTTELWKQFPNLGMLIPNLTKPLIKNTEFEHISVISSDLVPEDQGPVREWLRAYEFKGITALDLKHTISLEWAPFSICLVVGLDCRGLVEFIDAYNKQFGARAPTIGAHHRRDHAPVSKMSLMGAASVFFDHYRSPIDPFVVTP